MTTVRTQSFCNEASVSGGPTTVYTVPAGEIAVVTAISVVWGDVTISGLDAWLQSGTLAKLVRVTKAAGISDDTIGGTAQWYGRWVLDPGDTLAVQTVAGTCDLFAAGYTLTLP